MTSYRDTNRPRTELNSPETGISRGTRSPWIWAVVFFATAIGIRYGPLYVLGDVTTVDLDSIVNLSLYLFSWCFWMLGTYFFVTALHLHPGWTFFGLFSVLGLVALLIFSRYKKTPQENPEDW